MEGYPRCGVALSDGVELEVGLMPGGTKYARLDNVPVNETELHWLWRHRYVYGYTGFSDGSIRMAGVRVTEAELQRLQCGEHWRDILFESPVAYAVTSDGRIIQLVPR